MNRLGSSRGSVSRSLPASARRPPARPRARPDVPFRLHEETASSMNTHQWTALGELYSERMTVRVDGRCMAPSVPDGAEVIVARASTYLPGDILVVTRSGHLPVAHRLIGAAPVRGRMRYLTRADHADAPDGSVCRSRILGRVVAVAGRPDFEITLADRVRALSRFLAFVFARSVLGRRAVGAPRSWPSPRPS